MERPSVVWALVLELCLVLAGLQWDRCFSWKDYFVAVRYFVDHSCPVLACLELGGYLAFQVVFLVVRSRGFVQEDHL